MSSVSVNGNRQSVAPIDVLLSEVRESGVGVIRAAFDPEEIGHARRTVLANVDLMKNTRPTPSSRHLAGFHRFPTLESMHFLITENEQIRAVMTGLVGTDCRTIGLSDITINRSQQWHKDLLRGQFRHHLQDDDPCAKHHGKLFKVIVYLQDSSSLHVVPGSHRRDVSLESDLFAIPNLDAPVSQISAQAGDAVVIDICTTHRGSEEEAFESQGAIDHPKILVSTVFGPSACEFADQMELGNAARLSWWRQSGSELARHQA